MNLNLSSMVSLQDHSVGLILIFIGPRKKISHLNLISMGKSFKGTKKKQDKNTFKMFEVPIGNSKHAEKLSFTVRPNDQVLSKVIE